MQTQRTTFVLPGALLGALLAAGLLGCFADKPSSIVCPVTGIVCPSDTQCAAAQAACLGTPCGNGQIDGTEECDDGNIMNGDNCSSQCKMEACGNGTRDPQEACDDGNRTSGDGCSKDCTVESCGNGVVDQGEQCDDGNQDDTDACVKCMNAVCGDGKTRTGVEACDDGNTTNGDGCSSLCRLEGCGNGVLDPGEECDDGNAINTDACVEGCKIAVCGDNFIRAGVEACDDHNTMNGDGCSSNCRLESCGNGTRDPGEQCDDGNTTSGDGCSSACVLESCGDGVVNTGEDCDDHGESATCNADCTMARCGDKKVNQTALEQCDDGAGFNANNRDCTAACKINICTDGNINTVGPNHIEACDDGDMINTNGCSNACQPAGCGNGQLDGTEECDDGNTVATDACTAACLNARCGDGIIRTGRELCDTNPITVNGITYQCSAPGGNTPGCQPIRCGNGIIDSGEECDDDFVTLGTANPTSNNNDGCSNQCKIEYCGDGVKNNAVEACDPGPVSAGSHIAGESASCNRNCTAPSCGDGIVNTHFSPNGDMLTEQCDDGGTVNGDGCSASCRFESCGNGVVDPGEQCDAGTAGSASCYPSTSPLGCLSIMCGNNRIDTGEQCEPPNTRGCNATCQTIDYCGDGRITGTETCDPPNTATCNADCTATSCGDGKVNPLAVPPEACDAGGGATPNFSATCDNDCTAAACGDGKTNTLAGEQCDAGASNSYTGACLPNCQTNNVCGDGFKGPMEMCDDGNNMTETTCPYNSTCAVCAAGCMTAPTTITGPHCGDGTCQTGNGETNANCSADCTYTCGNGTQELGELCDYGSGKNTGTVCSNGSAPAYNSSCVACASGCTMVVALSPRCGDSVLQTTAGETCDDGNSTNGDGCTGCRVDAGYTCTGTGAGSCSLACGNGVRDTGEGCDDGAHVPGDGCSATCTVESGYSCVHTAMTETCTTMCGDGIVAGTEQCDGSIGSATCTTGFTGTPLCTACMIDRSYPACKKNCTMDTDCMASQYCDATNLCVADLATGAPCTRDAQCPTTCHMGTNVCD